MDLRTLVLLAAVGLTGCRTPSAPPSPSTEESAGPSFAELADAFFLAELEMWPQWGTDLGLHAYDGRLPDVSKEALDAYARRLEADRARFAALDVRSPANAHERAVILNHIDTELFELRSTREPFRNPMSYPGKLGLADYVSRDYAPAAIRAERLAALCGEAPRYFAQAMETLEPPFPRTWLATALLQVRGMRSFIRDDILDAFSTLAAPEQEALKAGIAPCDSALGDYEAYLVQHEASATDDFRLGPERFAEMLRMTEGVDIDLDRLEAIGLADLERNRASLEAAARALGKSIPEAMALVMADKPDANRVLAVATQQAEEMRELLVRERIVTIPSEDVAIVKVSPPFMRWNSAFLSSAGPFEEKDLPSFYYISPPDPSWPEAVRRDYIPNRHDLLFVTIHELWPGHFLHSLHRKQSPSKNAKAFCSYAMSEGWAHYTEEMMFEAGAGDADPRTHIGQLQNALLRNVRYLSAIGLHAGDMTVEDSKRLFLEKGLQDEGNAMQQAVRGTFDPGYLNYTLGKLMIRKLHADWKAQRGDAYSLQAFHDTFLSFQCAPLPAIRELMLGEVGEVL